MRYLILLSASLLATIAAFISVSGLSKIFVGIFAPFIILELCKVVAALFLHANWNTAPKAIKLYLSTAIVILMALTSTGIYGYLSNAAMVHTTSSQDQTAKVAYIDDQLKSLESRRKELIAEKSKLDGLVESLTKSERTVTTGTALYGRQKAQRQALDTDIATIDKNVSALRLKRSTTESSNRSLQAEVGPAIYLAKTFYGDSSIGSIEGAIRIVIYLIVFAFDPLAVVLLIAAQHSFVVPEQKQEKVVRPRKRKVKQKKVVKSIAEQTEPIVEPVVIQQSNPDDYPKQIGDAIVDAGRMLVKKQSA
jgi:hypothetical protein